MDGVITVLSGMSNIEQMKDNLSYMKDFTKLSEDEEVTIKEAQEVLKSITANKLMNINWEYIAHSILSFNAQISVFTWNN